MYCERCNIEFQEGLRFCKWCGNTLTERRRVTSELHGCPSCAAPIQGNWAFCKACGVKLSPPAAGPAGEFCPRCGSKSDPGWLNCARCGEDLGRVKAPKHTTVTSTPGRSVLSHCSECGDKIEPGATYCKGCGAAVYAPSSAFGASSLLCRVCSSHSPLGSPECRVCGAKFGEIGEGAPEAVKGKKSSTLPDLDEHLPGSDFVDLNSETVMIEQPKESEEVISGAHTLIIGPSGAIEPPPRAAEMAGGEEAAGKAGTGDRSAGGAETTVLPGVAGSKSEQPSPTAIISESRITGPVEEGEQGILDEEGPPEAAREVKRNPLSTQLDMPAVRPEELQTLIQAAEKPPAQSPPVQSSEPVESKPPVNATVVMGSVSVDEEKKVVEEESGPLYSYNMTAPFGLEESEAEPESKPGTTPDLVSPQVESEAVVGKTMAQHKSANTADFSGNAQGWGGGPQMAQTVTHQPAIAQGSEVARPQMPAPRVPAPQAPVDQPQKKGPIVASLVVAFIVLAVSGFVVWWFIAGGSKPEPVSQPTVTPPPVPETPPAPPPPQAPPVAPEGMVYVPGGIYTIGRDDGDAIASPARSVTLSAFFIDRTEVTNAEYKKFIDATGRRAPSDWKDGSYPENRENWPVVNVSWQDAADYADWIGKRLPTEEEWEAAARGTDKRVYPWGNQWLPGVANAETKGVTEVGQYRDGASPFGALDMIGNVWEWTADTFELYPGSTAEVPPTKEPGVTYYVIRGGAYDGNKGNDATRRGFLKPDEGYPRTGFRLAKDAK